MNPDDTQLKEPRVEGPQTGVGLAVVSRPTNQDVDIATSFLSATSVSLVCVRS